MFLSCILSGEKGKKRGIKRKKGVKINYASVGEVFFVGFELIININNIIKKGQPKGRLLLL